VEWRPIGWHTGKRCLRCVLCSTSDSYLHSERQIIPTPSVWESNLGQHAETRLPVPINLPLISRRGKSEPRGTSAMRPVC
jgi:hypothetical protein